MTNHEGLKKLYLNTYKQRLRNRPINDNFEKIKKHKDELFELKMKIASDNRSKPWNMKELKTVSKKLKRRLLGIHAPCVCRYIMYTKLGAMY